MKVSDTINRCMCLLVALAIAVVPLGCRNPAQSTLPPSAISPPGTPVPILAKGDVYADETELDPATPIQPGDVLNVVIRRGAGEEELSAHVHKTGLTSLSFAEVEVQGLTADQAAMRIQEAVQPFMRNPYVQVRIKRDRLKIKRVFVFGAVKKPGMYPMNRHMTVMEALLAAENYKETALLEEIRVIRGNLDRPEVLTADLARLFTYGDRARNLALQENDVVYVPREPLGDATEAARKLVPIVQVVMAPLQAAFIGKVLSDND
jgi:protein involved in polysaccharide export with SLBB domain